MSDADPHRRDCPAKVNLFLEVLSRRADGFHEIRTVFAPVTLFDTLTAQAADAGVSLSVKGADLPADERNLAFRAAEAFLARFAPDRGAKLELQKRIPVAAGLGGGSSDAAGALRLLRDILRPELPVEDLHPVAAELGSDVPYFLEGGLALGEGRGERLHPLGDPPAAWLALFLPEFGVSTARVYDAVEAPEAGERRSVDGLLAALRAGSPGGRWTGRLFNRLEAAAVRVDPRLGALRERLRRALAPGGPMLLSGSGSTFFAPAGSFSAASAIARDWSHLADGRALVVRMSDRAAGERSEVAG